MTTTLIVDGYNAINAIPEIKSDIARGLSFARESILALSKEFARSSGYITDVKVVFDGRDRYRGDAAFGFGGRRECIFSGTGTGDEKIIETIKEASRKGRVVVASNDNYVRNNSRAYGAAIMSSEDLLRRKGGDRRRARSGSSAKRKGSEKRIGHRSAAEITEQYRKDLGMA